MSLTSSENDAVTEDELNDMPMDVSEKSCTCAGLDGVEESDSIQALKGPEVNVATDLNVDWIAQPTGAEKLGRI